MIVLIPDHCLSINFEVARVLTEGLADIKQQSLPPEQEYTLVQRTSYSRVSPINAKRSRKRK